VAAPVVPALAYDTYKDTQRGYELKYPTGLQKSDSNKNYDLFLRDLIEPLESVSVRITDTKRKSLDEIGNATEVAQLLMKDNTPEKAPKELISAESKVDASGRRYDVVEYAFQWKFEDDLAQRLGRKRFQLHQKALITVDRRKQYFVLVGAEEDRWPIVGEGQLAVAIDTFTLLFD